MSEQRIYHALGLHLHQPPGNMLEVLKNVITSYSIHYTKLYERGNYSPHWLEKLWHAEITRPISWGRFGTWKLLVQLVGGALARGN